MDERKALDQTASSLMIVLCMVWGLQQVILKMAASDISPLMQIALRSGLAALLLLPLVLLDQKSQLMNPKNVKAGALVAVLFSLEFFLLAQALQLTSASHAVVLLYTAPIFVALGLHWKLPSERLTLLQWTGIGIAFIGIVVTFIRPQQIGVNTFQQQMLWGDLYALAAAIAWAATTVTVRLSSLAQAAVTQTLFYQLAGSFILLLGLAFFMGQAVVQWTPLVMGSLAFHTLIVSFASFLAWFWLLRNYLASRLGVFSFLTPLFGIIFGVWLLDENIEANFIFGTALVLLGILVVSLQGWLRK
ncbi:DMT family transporter [Acinetobacter junii]|uniref:DMT family transporter n=1 Tax=Acinetobacter junii TaxID=40215 RepID=A0ABU8ZK90_ACIJU|nr:DMT family transporter [Acinetobacter junii]MDA3506951.1 DMT family transporter [Acinetobacter junii]MDA3531598.1 DMT family transporter [Acinetobacter junii]MDH1917116.1 DMT family transporter [Acinetobacter junii]MDR7656433.1 DMT family transporter [Acinetobacter junii]QUS49647.1 DMT family transporter [Acinetobacter junii]